jgi:hypothetical protein
MRIYKSYANGAVKELGSAKDMQQWWQWKNNELLNSNSPTIPLIKHPNVGCDVAQEAEAVAH